MGMAAAQQQFSSKRPCLNNQQTQGTCSSSSDATVTASIPPAVSSFLRILVEPRSAAGEELCALAHERGLLSERDCESYHQTRHREFHDLTERQLNYRHGLNKKMLS